VDDLESWINQLAHQLFHIPRSITGPGLEESLSIIGREMPPTVKLGFRSGSKVLDWTVPPVWLCRRATLRDPNGVVIADFNRSSLEVVNYSVPVDRHMTREQLLEEQRLHSLPSLPTAVPYVTSYYAENWGFCLPDETLVNLPAGVYHAHIDSSFDEAGYLPVHQTLLPGVTSREILLTSYLCHPELGNNELSGPLALAALYKRIAGRPDRYFSYRFVLGPETIGAIALLSVMLEQFRASLYGGFVLTCLGGPKGALRIKLPKDSETSFARFCRTYAGMVGGWKPEAFDPLEGSDERQYCSPGANLPISQIARTVYQQYPEYHTSADNLAFMDVMKVADSVRRIESMLLRLETLMPRSLSVTAGEPQLGRRNLYPNTNAPGVGFNADTETAQIRRTKVILQVLSAADGQTNLIDLIEGEAELAEFEDVLTELDEAGLTQRRWQAP